MSNVLVGATSGMVMAAVFIPVFSLVMVSLVRDGPPWFQSLLKRGSPVAVVMSVVVLSYPAWSVVGAVMGLLYSATVEAAPGGGIGSPNVVFTLAVAIGVAMVTAPAVVLFKRFVVGVMVLALAFAGIFGWFLPLFAAS